MAGKTPRMKTLEAMIAEDPGDSELRYFLAMEYLSAGDEAEAINRLRDLTSNSSYVPAFLQAGQLLSRAGHVSEACGILRKGIVTAETQGNSHALGEMQGLLDSLE